MRYDFSRDTFQPSKQYSRVLMRQGAILLDADWNEQQAILLDYMRTLACDMFGPHAGPEADAGFEILCSALSDWKGPWEKAIKRKAVEETSRGMIETAIDGGDLVILPGRYYVDGILIENETPVLYSLQQSYPAGTLLLRELRAKPMLVYLEIWERAITYVQDDAIRDAALGGVETCGRARVNWRVVAMSAPPAAPHAPQFDCTFVDTLPHVSAGTLRARAKQDTAAIGPCVISPDASYRGPENQLYRVEIHQGGTATGKDDGATFKFSSENGSVIFPLAAMPGTAAADIVVRLETLWRDRRFGLEAGDWVELGNDGTEEGGLPGPLLQVKETCGDTLEVTLTPASVRASMAVPYETIAKDGVAANPFLRRWDHHGDKENFCGALAATADDGDWLPLEDGIQIQFAKDVMYRAGDYWLIPARVANGDIDWPSENGADGTTGPQALHPRGPIYHYAPLLFVTEAGEASDCRCLIKRQCPGSTDNGLADAAVAAAAAPAQPRRKRSPSG